VWTVVAGSLPTGLSLARADGTISGTPTAAGTSSVTVQVEDAGHQFATTALTIIVQSVLAPRLPKGGRWGLFKLWSPEKSYRFKFVTREAHPTPYMGRNFP